MKTAILIALIALATLTGCADGEFRNLQDQATKAHAWVETLRPAAERSLAYLETVDQAQIEEWKRALPVLEGETKDKVAARLREYQNALHNVQAYDKAARSLGAAEASLAAFSDKSHAEPHEAIQAALNASAGFAGPYAPFVNLAAVIVGAVGGVLAGMKKGRADTEKVAGRAFRAIETIKNTGTAPSVDFVVNADKLKALMGDDARDLVKRTTK